YYRICDLEGHELESNFGKDPVAYLHGHNNMMVGIERALEGKAADDELSVELAASETFGEFVENAHQRVSVKHLQGAKKWQPGMTAVLQTDKGAMEVSIVKVGKFMATVDTNHPMGGRTLNFDLKVESVRDATNEEVSHGHAHGVGGHQH
ncbi:peptidylprolyl isomerase, partial [Aliiglaciecola sp.]|nr:peptidylprolyl isomerase [Aliiglaciecola sp.]